jgi:Glycosyltransferase
MPQICFLLGGFTGNGGIGRVTSILVNSLCDNDIYKFYTLSFYNDNKENLYSINKKVKQDYLFNSPINMTRGILYGGISKLRRYLKINNIDILIACGALYYPISILGCKGTKTKCLCWEHSNVQNSEDHSFQKICRKYGAKNADFIITLTKHDKKSYIDKYKVGNIMQIYNPIDSKIFDYLSEYKENSHKLVSVGRLTYQKNFSMLIDIAKEVLGNNPDWSWDIYGEGELRNELEEKIRAYNLEGRLRLKGQVNNLYELYNDYSMLIMTSLYEGFPMTLLEAMACGLPLISFDILTGPNEIIVDGDNGYLVKPFDINQIIILINSLIRDQQKRIDMSQNGKVICNKYKISSICNEWVNLFKRILHEK